MTQIATHDRREQIALIAALPTIAVSVCLLAGAFSAVKLGLTAYTPGQLAFLRFTVASVALGAYVVISGSALPPREEWRRLLLLAVLNVVGYHLLFNSGQATVSAAAGSVLINTSPLWTTLSAALLLDEKPRTTVWVGMLFAFLGAGIIAIAERGPFTVSPGATLVLLAAIVQGVSFVIQKPLATQYGPVGVTAVYFWLGTVILAARYGISGAVALHAAPWQATTAVVFVGLGSSAIGMVLWARVLTRVPASRAAPFLLLVPATATALASVVLQEVPSHPTLLGLIVTFVGIALTVGLPKTRMRE